jgi:hypothetical protein
MKTMTRNRTGTDRMIASAFVFKSRKRHLAGHVGVITRVIEKLVQAPGYTSRKQHACRLEFRTNAGRVLHVVAEDSRLVGAIDRAFRKAKAQVESQLVGVGYPLES